jgi:hypothetical protein
MLFYRRWRAKYNRMQRKNASITRVFRGTILKNTKNKSHIHPHIPGTFGAGFFVEGRLLFCLKLFAEADADYFRYIKQ